MKNTTLIICTLAATLVAGMAIADVDCHEPVANWQPRDALRQLLEEKGWEVHRIKIDDGCYEVKGVDQDGNQVEAEYEPASLRLRKLEIEYDYKQEGDDLHRGSDARTAPYSTTALSAAGHQHQIAPIPSHSGDRQ